MGEDQTSPWIVHHQFKLRSREKNTRLGLPIKWSLSKLTSLNWLLRTLHPMPKCHPLWHCWLSSRLTLNPISSLFSTKNKVLSYTLTTELFSFFPLLSNFPLLSSLSKFPSRFTLFHDKIKHLCPQQQQKLLHLQPSQRFLMFSFIMYPSCRAMIPSQSHVKPYLCNSCTLK